MKVCQNPSFISTYHHITDVSVLKNMVFVVDPPNPPPPLLALT